MLCFKIFEKKNLMTILTSGVGITGDRPLSEMHTICFRRSPDPLAGFGSDCEGRRQKILGRTPLQNPGYGPD